MSDLNNHYLCASIQVEPAELTGRVCSPMGQALQYIIRRNFKENTKDDLAKAIYWLEFMCKNQNCVPGSENLSCYVRGCESDGDSQLQLWKLLCTDTFVVKILKILFPTKDLFTTKLDIQKAINELKDLRKIYE